MDWKQLGRTVARSAPGLGAALAGPAGAVVGGIVARAFGTGSTPDELAQVIANDPDAAVKLREVELHNAQTIAAIITTDRQHARATHKGHPMTWILTTVLSVMVAALVGALMLLETPPANREVVYLIAGQLIGAFATAVAYWLGSSRGSVEKQDQILRL